MNGFNLMNFRSSLSVITLLELLKESFPFCHLALLEYSFQHFLLLSRHIHINTLSKLYDYPVSFVTPTPH